MSTNVNRNALQEWVKWMVLTASLFLIDGGCYSIKYPYETFVFSDRFNLYLGPKTAYGPTNRSLGPDGKPVFPFAPVIPITGPTLPLISLVAFGGAVFCFIIESDLIPIVPKSLHERHTSIKSIFYGLLGIYTINQFTLVQPSIFLIVASACLLYDNAFIERTAVCSSKA